jgi:hypothetical protein
MMIKNIVYNKKSAYCLRQMFVLLLMFCGLMACKRKNPFPVEPHLAFVSFEKISTGTEIDDRATLKLHFTDGDGNIGSDDTDNYPPFDNPEYRSFFFFFYAK